MDGIQTFSCNGVLNFVDYRDRCVEVPTQDFRTKNVIQLLAVQMNKFFMKYPKLKAECHASILDLFSGELLDMIQVD